VAREPVTILGVDTSLRATGLAAVRSDGLRHTALAYDVVRCPAAWPHTRCLMRLADAVGDWLARHAVGAVAIEGIFYCRNARTALVLGEARGAALAVCARAGVPVYEHAPRSVKQAVAGWGAATKDQVGRMVRGQLGLAEDPPEDAADALALALCHAQQGLRMRLGTLKTL